MTLVDLIRKRESAHVATATPAIPATKPAEQALTVAKIATVAVAKPASAAANDEAGHGRLPDPETDRRRARALALLQANPTWQRAVVAEAGDPAIIGIAIRGVAYGEVEIPAANYDPVALLALLDQYGCSIH